MNKLLVNIVRGLMIALSKLPLKFHYFMADILAWLMRKVLRYRYSTVMINLSRSFPDKKYRSLQRPYGSAAAATRGSAGTIS